MGKKVQNRLLQCYICKMFVKLKVSNLRRHMKLHGPIVDCYECVECGTKFQTKISLKSHWSKHHKNRGNAKFKKAKRAAKCMQKKKIYQQ